MAWIESHQELRHHPKLSAVRQKLAAERNQVIGSLHLLWWWCMDYALDGDLTKYTHQQIAEASDWKGDAGAYVEALIEGGFIDRVGDSIKVHDWLDFCGEIVIKRLERRKVKRTRSAENGRRTADILRQKPPNGRNISPTVPNQTRPKSIWVKPTLPEISEYCKQRRNLVNPTKFFNHYESNGWMVGKNKMKNWKAAVHTWEQSEGGLSEKPKRDASFFSVPDDQLVQKT